MLSQEACGVCACCKWLCFCQWRMRDFAGGGGVGGGVGGGLHLCRVMVLSVGGSGGRHWY